MRNDSKFLMYQTENGETKINVRLEDETVWMTQKAMAELYHIKQHHKILHFM